MKRKTAVKISLVGVIISLIGIIIELFLSDGFSVPILTVFCSNIAILICNVNLMKQGK